MVESRWFTLGHGGDARCSAFVVAHPWWRDPAPGQPARQRARGRDTKPACHGACTTRPRCTAPLHQQAPRQAPTRRLIAHPLQDHRARRAALEPGRRIDNPYPVERARHAFCIGRRPVRGRQPAKGAPPSFSPAPPAPRARNRRQSQVGERGGLRKTGCCGFLSPPAPSNPPAPHSFPIPPSRMEVRPCPASLKKAETP